MKTLALKQDKSFVVSVGVHAALLVLALLPFAHKVMEKQPVEYVMEFEVMPDPMEERTIGSEGLQAKSPVYNEEPEPTMDQPMEEPIPVKEDMPVEEVKIEEQTTEVVSEVVTETEESDVAAAESNASGSDEETSANGGGHGAPIEGNQDGAATAGDGGGGDGMEGDGVITRRVIHRENITQIAKVSGKVVLRVAIDRAGKVTYVAYMPEKSTITDDDLIKRASHLAAKYRYEADYKAPKREWGELTFIFRVNEANNLVSLPNANSFDLITPMPLN
jgi:hypothetical protein